MKAGMQVGVWQESSLGCWERIRVRYGGIRLRTKAGAAHTLRAVSSWTNAVVATSGVFTDLVISALMCAVMAFINVYKQDKNAFIFNHNPIMYQ